MSHGRRPVLLGSMNSTAARVWCLLGLRTSWLNALCVCILSGVLDVAACQQRLAEARAPGATAFELASVCARR